MEKFIASPDRERFESGADKYAAYLETPEGRLRLDLAFANLQEFLPHAAQPSPCAWRNLATTSPCWIPPSRCWTSRNVAHGKQELPGEYR